MNTDFQQMGMKKLADVNESSFVDISANVNRDFLYALQKFTIQ